MRNLLTTLLALLLWACGPTRDNLLDPANDCGNGKDCSCPDGLVNDGTGCVTWLVLRNPGGVLFEFSKIPPGTFFMGSPESDVESYLDEKPQHRVIMSEPFLLLRNEVTQAQYESVMKTNPSRFIGQSERPVERVSWDDAVAFCARLDQLEGVVSGTYGLPTEAQWEYAARANSTASRNGAIEAVAWYSSNSANSTRPVRQKLPNRWQLYDMLGNVWEWTADWYDGYSAATQTDPTGPSGGSGRVIRGGSWSNVEADVSASVRHRDIQVGKSERVGFRIRRNLP